ncbi:MAG: enoyl-CoA hydratase/isomerase family protein [Thermoplasmatota archaeon]
MTEYKFLKTKTEDTIGIITLNNPPVNALSPALLDELDKALDEYNTSPVRVLIITGAGNNAFCAGADVKALAEAGPSGAEKLIAMGHAVFQKIENFRCPVIAAINNLTLGGGLEMSMSCDIRYASDRARFGQPEVNLGLIPGWGGTQRLTRLVGRARSKELIYTGQMINAQEALRIGLLNKVVPDGDELRAALDLAKRIAVKSSPVAVAAAKRAINVGADLPLEDGLGVEVKEVSSIARSEDLQEGIKAFIEKRQPAFKGK